MSRSGPMDTSPSKQIFQTQRSGKLSHTRELGEDGVKSDLDLKDLDGNRMQADILIMNVTK